MLRLRRRGSIYSRGNDSVECEGFCAAGARLDGVRVESGKHSLMKKKVSDMYELALVAPCP